MSYSGDRVITGCLNSGVSVGIHNDIHKGKRQESDKGDGGGRVIIEEVRQ